MKGNPKKKISTRQTSGIPSMLHVASRGQYSIPGNKAHIWISHASTQGRHANNNASNSLLYLLHACLFLLIFLFLVSYSFFLHVFLMYFFYFLFLPINFPPFFLSIFSFSLFFLTLFSRMTLPPFQIFSFFSPWLSLFRLLSAFPFIVTFPFLSLPPLFFLSHSSFSSLFPSSFPLLLSPSISLLPILPPLIPLLITSHSLSSLHTLFSLVFSTFPFPLHPPLVSVSPFLPPLTPSLFPSQPPAFHLSSRRPLWDLIPYKESHGIPRVCWGIESREEEPIKTLKNRKRRSEYEEEKEK